jgi:ATP-dependent protease ClpP protease subunit
MSKREPIRRDPKYRPNHDRSVTISGVIDEAIVARLLPEIVRLQSISRDAITVYIDSPGGNIEYAQLLLDALRASDQDCSEPCRLITVALGETCSAAADILMAGDYALAYPYSRILCHGTRIWPQSAFTKAEAAGYAKYMSGQDEEFAFTLARNCINRFVFRISRISRTIESLDETEPGLFRTDNFPPIERISHGFRKFLQTNGLVREDILRQLDVAVKNMSDTIMLVPKYEEDIAKNASHREQKIRDAILNYALEDTSSEARFSDLETKYLLVRDFFAPHHFEIIGTLRRRWWGDLLNSDEVQKAFIPASAQEVASQLPERITMRCISLWFFFVFFCRQLQTGDFPMTATEAYWLGLIDEVIGIDLPSPRILVENAPDVPNEAQGASQS